MRSTYSCRSRLVLTNAGRYWVLHGGFLAFLKEEPDRAFGGRGSSPEAEALWANYMALRLKTFGGASASPSPGS